MSGTRTRGVMIVMSALLAMSALFAMSACSVNQEVRMNRELGAESDMRVELADEMLEYLLDLSGVLGEQEGDVSPFDLETLAVLMQEEPGLDLVGTNIPEIHVLTMSLTAEEIERVFIEGPHRVEGLIDVQSSGRERTVTIELDRDRMQQITGLSPVEEQSAVDFLLPPERMDTDEYVEYLAWAMEEYEGATPIEEVIRNARIELRVAVPGELVRVEGGDAEGNSAVFVEGVARLLTVRETTRWSLTWRQ